MSGRHSVNDNAFIERLWRTVKYENSRFKDYQNGTTMFLGLEKFMTFYNTIRRHSSIGNKRPKEVYEQSEKTLITSLK